MTCAEILGLCLKQRRRFRSACLDGSAKGPPDESDSARMGASRSSPSHSCSGQLAGVGDKAVLLRPGFAGSLEEGNLSAIAVTVKDRAEHRSTNSQRPCAGGERRRHVRH